MTELHIASCVARIRPEAINRAIEEIELVIGCAVSGRDLDSIGKVVLVLEGDSTGALLDQMEKIRCINGVLSIDMVYQHAEEESVMEEVIR